MAGKKVGIEGRYNPLIPDMELSIEIEKLLIKAELERAGDAILSQKQLETIGLNNDQIHELLIATQKVMQDSIKTFVMNYIIVAGTENEVQIVRSNLESTFKNINRMTFFNTNQKNIDNTQGAYFYDETYKLHAKSIPHALKDAGEQMPTILCQLVTDHELTANDILNLQPVNNDLQIAHYWHLKNVSYFSIEEPNHLTDMYQRAGYLMTYRNEILEDERRNHMSDYFINFISENKIDTFCECPKCGENMSMAELHINGECPDCKDRMKAKLIASFKSTLS